MTRLKLFVTLTAGIAALLAGCDEDQGALEVEVTTDQLPGVEFSSVRTALFDELPTSGGHLHLTPALRDVGPDDDWESGVMVARFDPIERRRWAVQVELLDDTGETINVRAVSTALRHATDTIRVDVTRVVTSHPDGGMPDAGAPDAGTPADAATPPDGSPADGSSGS